MRFSAEMIAWGEFLQAHGVTAYIPDLLGNDEWNDATPERRRELAKQLALDHFSKMEISDVIFIFNEESYVGPSVTLEMGFAIAHKLPLFAKCQDVNEVCRDVWFDGYCDTKESLLNILKN